MINNEYRHLNMQMGQQRNTLEKQMSENQIIVNKIKSNNLYSNNNRFIMPDYNNDYNSNININYNDNESELNYSRNPQSTIMSERRMKRDNLMTKSMDVNLRLPDINSSVSMSSVNQDFDYVKEKNAIKVMVNTPKNEYKKD